MFTVEMLEEVAGHEQEAVDYLLSLPPEQLNRVLATSLGYIQALPTIDEFIESPEYLGNVLEGRLFEDHKIEPGGSIYPKWRELLREIYPNPYWSRYQEVILSGSIGSGKTTVAKVGMLYDMYRMAMMENAHASYNLIKTTSVVFALINATMTLASNVLANELWDWMNTSPMFKVLTTKAEQGHMLPNRIGLVVGSRVGHTLGQAVPGCILDELNFQDKVQNQAMDNYNSIKRRMVSRFFNKRGYPGRMWLVSSATLDNSFVNQLIEKSENKNNIKYVSNAIWEVKDHIYGQYPTFPVFIGDNNKDPFIVNDLNAVKGYIDPDRIIQVPDKLKEDFEGDIYKALQDLAGVSTVSSFRYISSKEKINIATIGRNWFGRDIISVDFFEQADTVFSKMDREAFDKRMNKTSMRFIHIDIGYASDKTGIGICHIANFVNKKRYDPVTGRTSVSNDPCFIVDCAIAIEKKPGQEVPIYKIRDFIMDLRTMGLPIHMVTTDGFQSVQLRQELELLGFEVDLISLDRKSDGYDMFKNALYEHRVSLPINALLTKELGELVKQDGKVDHPADGSKDTSDGVAGSVYSAWLKRDTYINPVSGLEQLSDIDFINNPEKYLGSSTKDFFLK